MSTNSASTSSSSQGSVKEYVVRVPKTNKKKYHMMRFNADLGSDFFKSWTQCKLERENNFKEYKMEEEIPKFGAGSEFGREQREEARRKRFGINVKKYRSEDQPWMLNTGGKNGKKFKGIREGGVAANVSWYVFMQGKDGSFEAYPIEEWYNFQPIQRYKALSAEEAEEEFVRRDKIMNFFQVMYEKKFRKDAGDVDEEEGGKKKGGKKSLMLSEMDDWVSDDDDDDDGEDRNDDDDGDSDGGKKKKKKKRRKMPLNKKKTGGKKKTREGGESEDSCEEESDDFNEGAEHDYISSDSSDSDQQDENIVSKELAGVEEGDALRKLLASDDDDENEEEDKEKEEEEEKNKEEETEEKEKKKKKKKKKDKKSDDKDSDGESSNSSAEEGKKKKNGSKNPERKKAVNDLKKKVKENPHEMPENKRLKLDPSAAGASGAGSPAATDSMEEAIRRYLMRKPMTTTELLKNFKKKKDMNSEQLVTSIAQILKRVNPVKRMIKGKMYLSLKST